MALARVPASPFEGHFARHAGAIPQDYLRALAYRESGFRPGVVHPTSGATGLFQITAPALADFNQKQASALQLAHLVDPELNTRVAAGHLQQVIDTYRRHRSLRPDWSSRRWIELLTLGWNAGHNAVARIAGRMEASNIPPERITVDSVSQVARGLGQARFVADPQRVAWSKSVAKLYLRGAQAPEGRGMMVAQAGLGGGGGPLPLIMLLAAGALVYAAGRREAA